MAGDARPRSIEVGPTADQFRSMLLQVVERATRRSGVRAIELRLSALVPRRADRDLAEWLWWEYRMTQQTSVPWDGWVRP